MPAGPNGWLSSEPGIPVRHYDLTKSPYRRGNGPFRRGACYGWILHVNVGITPVSLFMADENHGNPNSVTPTIQVFPSIEQGGVAQFLPLNWQPWCQINGNFNYGAAEVAGFPNQLMTDFQLKALAYYHREMRRVMGTPDAIANYPGARGIGTHVMGGQSWGGHTCPGPGPRAGQRAKIIELSRGTSEPAPPPHKPGAPYLRHAWPSYMHTDHYFGLISGPDESHGGYNESERPAIRLIQQRLQELGYAPQGAGWADGIFEEPTRVAVAKWQAAHHHTALPGRVYKASWDTLFTY